VCKVNWCSWGGGGGGVGIIFTVEYEEDTNCLKCGFFFLLAVARICLAVLKIALLCGIWWWGGGGGGGGYLKA
jgi:hypothetical protein